MRLLPATAAALALCALSAWPVRADDVTTSSLIATEGLSGAVAQLEVAPPSPDRDLALAALHFLRGLESAWQARWRIGATDPVLPLPVLGTALPRNPAPQPMQADFLSILAEELGAAMETSRDALPQGDAALVLRLPDLWLDVDSDGRRGPDEGLTHLAGLPLPEDGLAEIRFDAADGNWLRAYTHLIQSMTELTLAFDPRPALARRIALGAVLADQFAEPPGQLARPPNLDQQAQVFGPLVDNLAVLLQTLRNQPDKARVADAADHLRHMIAANRAFWTAVADETDNDREWIPNDRQQAALGFVLPEGAGRTWLAVLGDAEQALDGRMLVPFWRFAPGYGIDLSMWLDDPKPVDVIDWIQGSAALPHARPGLTVGSENWGRFLAMFPGRAGLYMVLFN